MKAWDIADSFRALVAEDTDFAGIALRTGQSEEEQTFPCIIFEASVKPVGGSAQVLTFELTMHVHSHAHDDTAAAHAARAELLRRKFYGATQAESAAARDAIKTAINTAGKFALLGRGHDAPSDSANGAIEQSRFKTSIIIAGTVRVLDPAP